MTYTATFFTHFGALNLNRSLKKKGIPSRMMPVPRSLSASCGVCVSFEAAGPECSRGAEDLEAVYQQDPAGFRLLFRSE